MKESMKAYLAGCMDCDGSFTIVSQGDGTRVQPWVLFGQVTPQIPNLLLEIVGGYLYYNERPLPRQPYYMWRGTCKVAVSLCQTLLPYLRIKQDQAAIILELDKLNKDPRLRRYTYWYEREHPNWKQEELVTTGEAQHILGYGHFKSVGLAIRQGRLLAIPGKGGKQIPRIPKGYVTWIADIKRRFKKQKLTTVPPALVDRRRDLMQQIRKLNHRRFKKGGATSGAE